MKNKFKIIIISSISVVLVSIIGVFGYMYTHQNLYEANAKIGVMPGSQVNLQKQADDSMTTFSANYDPVLKDHQCNLFLENPKDNNKLIQATLILKNGTTLYTTKFIKPGSYIDTINIDTDLQKGNYSAMLYINSYDLRTLKLIGNSQNSRGALITIHVI